MHAGLLLKAAINRQQWVAAGGDIRERVLDAVLSNQLKLADLETLMRGDAQALPDTDATRPSRNTAQKYALFNRLEAYFDSSKLHPFDTYKGRVIRRRGTLGSPGGYYLYDAQEKMKCLVLCIQPGAWRDPATAARELYEHALSQRHLAPTIWFVFERANLVLQRLAELSLYWGGSATKTLLGKLHLSVSPQCMHQRE